MFNLFGGKKEELDMEKGGVVIIFTMLVHIAKCLNISPEEFARFIDDIDTPQDYLNEVLIARLKMKKSKANDL